MLLEMSTKGWLSPHTSKPLPGAAGASPHSDRRLCPHPEGLQDAEGQNALPFHGKTLFHRLLWASGAFTSIVTRSGTSHRSQPSCKVQSDRDAPRINLTDATGLHPTWIWASVYS